MSDEMISRSRAGTVRLASQAAAAVLLGGAVLVAVVGLPGQEEHAISEVTYTEIMGRAGEQARTIEAGEPEEAAGTLPADIEAIAYSLGQIENAPVPVVEQAEEPTAEPAEVVEQCE